MVPELFDAPRSNGLRGAECGPGIHGVEVGSSKAHLLGPTGLHFVSVAYAESQRGSIRSVPCDLPVGRKAGRIRMLRGVDIDPFQRISQRRLPDERGLKRSVLRIGSVEFSRHPGRKAGGWSWMSRYASRRGRADIQRSCLWEIRAAIPASIASCRRACRYSFWMSKRVRSLSFLASKLSPR